MKNKSLVIGIVLAILCIVCLAVGLYGPIKNKISKSNPGETVTGGDSAVTATNPDGTPAYETNPDGTPASTLTPSEIKKEEKQLSEYRAVTNDVYAMIRIPGTNIDYPVAQNPENDNLYLRHDVDGRFSPNGTLFTEHTYNSADFSDRVTVIYGHNMTDGEMFGNLQEYYSDEATFGRYGDIYITTEGKTLHYKVFAATPYVNTHILYHYNKFPTDESVDSFLNSVYSSREFGINIDEANKADSSDKILVLSTCLKGNYSKRFIVLAKLEENT